MKFKNFIDLSDSEKEFVLKWRNSEKIAKFMKNSNIGFDEHLKFIQNLKNDSTKKYFLVYDGNEPIGVIDFINITLTSCEFGLYGIKKGVGNLLMEEIKKYAFNVLKVKTLKACVFKENLKALNLYLKNGFLIQSEDDKFFFVSLNSNVGGYNLDLIYLKVAI